MSHLILEHFTSNELPTEWAKQLSAGHNTFSVMIVTERCTPQSGTPALNTTKTPLFGIWRDYEACQDVDSYVRQLRRNRFESDLGT